MKEVRERIFYYGFAFEGNMYGLAQNKWMKG